MRSCRNTLPVREKRPDDKLSGVLKPEIRFGDAGASHARRVARVGVPRGIDSLR